MTHRTTVKIAIALVVVAIVATNFLFAVTQGVNKPSEKPLKVYVFNIGHGESALVVTPDNKTILIDAGSFDTFTNTSNFLAEHNVTTIDTFIVTHPHPDHISFAVDVIKHHEVGAIYMPGMADNLDVPGYERLMNAVNMSGALIYTNDQIHPGDFLNLSSKVTFQVMWIDKNATLINDGSIVLKMSYGNERFLFAADVEAWAEGQMVASGLDLSADILEVPHHGVNTSSTQPFLDSVHPSVAVLSCGYGYGAPPVPQQGVVARYSGIPIYSTMFQHEIDITMTMDSYKIEIISN